MNIFIEKISIDFNLNKEELMSAWEKHDEEYSKLNKMKKPELLEICKSNNYSQTGSKSDLLRNIINKVQKTPNPVKEKPVKKTTNNILDKIVKQSTIIVIKKNSYGNHEHLETGFVFEQSTKRVYGKQIGENVVTLTKEDIELCNKYNFKYEIPDSLGVDKNTNNEPETVDDIMEESLVVESDEESEEEIEYLV